MTIKEREKKRKKKLDLYRQLKNLGNMKVSVIPIVVGALGIAPQRLGKETGGIGNQRKN